MTIMYLWSSFVVELLLPTCLQVMQWPLGFSKGWRGCGDCGSVVAMS